MAAGAILLASAAQTVGTGSQLLASPDPSRVKAATFQVTCSATSSPTSLDVYLQESTDGTVFNDFIHFTQITAASSVVAKWVRDTTPTVPVGAPKDAALAVGVNQGPVGGIWRLKWVVVGTSFTFAVTGRFILDR